MQLLRAAADMDNGDFVLSTPNGQLGPDEDVDVILGGEGQLHHISRGTIKSAKPPALTNGRDRSKE